MRKSNKSLPMLLLLIFVSLLHYQPLLAKEDAPDSPKCGRSGPVSAPPDETYCGCTWGPVYYRGHPVPQIPVSIFFGGEQLTKKSFQTSEDLYPYYDLSAIDLGAKLNDVLTVTTTLDDRTVSRTFRARPDHEKNQEVALVIPQSKQWQSLLTGKTINTMLTQRNTLWAGGEQGLLRIDLSTRVSATITLPWTSQAVVALASDKNDHIWAAGSHSLAEFDGITWHNIPVPFGATIRALHMNPYTDTLWVGGGDNGSALAVYTGSWQSITQISGRVEAITTDKNGAVWIGSHKGLYRHDHALSSLNAGWVSYHTEDGLGSDDIRALTSDSQSVWVGGAPYDGGTDTPKGGISRYDLATATWQIFTETHGLPGDVDGSAAMIHSLAVDSRGQVWAGSVDGIYFRAVSNYWLNDSPAANQPVVAITSNDKNVFLARGNEIAILSEPSSSIASPVATMNAKELELSLNATVTISASVNSTLNNASPIVNWEWVSDLVGPLCTTDSSCVIPASLLGVGAHTVSLRIQNVLGVWSEPVETKVTITNSNPPAGISLVYLPLVVR